MDSFFEDIEAVKIHMPATRLQLEQCINRSNAQVSKVLLHLRLIGQIHVSGYTRTKYAHAPIYSLGTGEDVAYPESTPRAKRQRQIKAKKVKQPKLIKEKPLPFKLPARCKPQKPEYVKHSWTEAKAMPDLQNQTQWAGGNPFDRIRAVHSCSSSDVAWVKAN